MSTYISKIFNHENWFFVNDLLVLLLWLAVCIIKNELFANIVISLTILPLISHVLLLFRLRKRLPNLRVFTAVYIVIDILLVIFNV